MKTQITMPEMKRRKDIMLNLRQPAISPTMWVYSGTTKNCNKEHEV